MTQQLPYRPTGYSPTLERSGGLGTAVIVMAVVWTVGQWFTPPATRLLVASGTPTAFIAYNVLMSLLLLVGIATFVLVGLWLGQARRNADRIAPDQQRRSKVWVWLSWVVPIVWLWFPKQVVDDVWRSTVRDPGEPRTEWWWGTFIAVIVLMWFRAELYSISWVVNWVLVAGMTTVAAAFWIRVVQTISHAQNTLADQAVAPILTGPQPSEPPGCLTDNRWRQDRLAALTGGHQNFEHRELGDRFSDLDNRMPPETTSMTA